MQTGFLSKCLDFLSTMDEIKYDNTVSKRPDFDRIKARALSSNTAGSEWLTDLIGASEQTTLEAILGSSGQH